MDQLAQRATDRRFTWLAARVVRLRAGWAAGETRAALGCALHVSADAVGKKARQLDLPARPSPIPPPCPTTGPRRPPAHLRPGASTLPPLASAA